MKGRNPARNSGVRGKATMEPDLQEDVAGPVRKRNTCEACGRKRGKKTRDAFVRGNRKDKKRRMDHMEKEKRPKPQSAGHDLREKSPVDG